jgi:Flp pilus assembly protein TadG
MVEFALVAPLAFMLLLGVIVLGIVITSQVQLSNAVRDGARASAVCGSDPYPTTTTLPNGTKCSNGVDDANEDAYISSQLTSLHSSVAPATFTVLKPDGTVWGNDARYCVKGYTLKLTATYEQPLFLPFMGQFFGNPATNTRTINATAEATCEQ